MSDDNEDKKYVDSMENGEWTLVKNQKALLLELKETALNTMAKDQRMNIRIGKRDLEGIKARALEEGMPYQTLVASIIHKYVNGKLKDVS
ncbi:MAG: antitoxin [Treponema sp.]|nr:antitoxin [Treponema sp.]